MTAMGTPVVPSIHLLRSQVHFGWSRDHPPLLTVNSGSEVTLQTQDASGGQFSPSSTADEVAGLDFERVNPVTGPVFIYDARPGDVLEVELLAVEAGTWGWTAHIPSFGLLTDQFPDPWLHVWELDGPRASFENGVSVPLDPFCGVIGVAPAEPGLHSVVPPRRVGGNMDIKQLGAGTTVYLPVEVEGALLGVGDTHAAQGDGEVCGTAIECPMTVCLVAVDLKISEVVDAPNWVVSAFLPGDLFAPSR
jgi:acetamidase/formamidase